MYVDATKLPYRGVLIERPCSSCDTVDLHFEGNCAQGPCAVCGCKRGDHSYGDIDSHAWVPGRYQPALIADAPASFIALLHAVREIGMPTHFSSDLFRDYQALTGTGLWAGRAIDRFVWCVRSTGTDILSAHTTDSTVHLLLDRNERCFYWNGFVLAETDRDTARRLLVALRMGSPRGWEAVEA